MAGDWVPMRVDLDTDPAVVGIAQQLSVPETQVIGWLWKLWSVASCQTDSGWLPHYTPHKVDGLVSHSGFSAALESVGWLCPRPGGLEIPNFDHWLSQSGKLRLSEARRKREARRSSPARPENVREIPDKNGKPLLSSTVLSSSLSSEEKEGCGEGKEPARPPPSEEAADLAQRWVFGYRGKVRAERDPYAVAAEFQEWLDKLGVSAAQVLAEIGDTKRDRTEPTWAMKERLVHRPRAAAAKKPSLAEQLAEQRRKEAANAK